ncbi:MAG: hypothetical protein AAFX06_33310 [Planctomycetota bacterium]
MRQLDERVTNQQIITLLEGVASIANAEADQPTLDSDLGRLVADLNPRMAQTASTRSTQSFTSGSFTRRL